MDQPKYMYDVFISHSSKNKPWADAACAVLEKNGIRCWIAPRDIIPGEEWGAAIVRGISSSRMMVLVFSDHADKSEQVRREVERSLSRSMPLLPVRIENVNPTGAMEFALSNRHWLDAWNPPIEQKLEALAKSVKSLLETVPARVETPTAPPFPLEEGGRRLGEGVPPRPQDQAKQPLLAIIFGVVVLTSVITLGIAQFLKPDGPVDARVVAKPDTAKPAETTPKQTHPAPAEVAKTEVLKPPPPEPIESTPKKTMTPAPVEVAKVDIPKPAPPIPKPAPAPVTIDTTPKPFTNTIGMKFVPIPAGSFQMGSAESGQDDERPQHKVTLSAFNLGATEVTKGQFAQFVKDTAYKTDAEKDGEGGFGWNASDKKFERGEKYTWHFSGFDQTDVHPVVNVSWNDAVAFAEWLSKKEGRTYRLPTEAEWEYACRGGSTTKYQFGDDPEGLAEVGNVSDASTKVLFPEFKRIEASDGFVFTAPVGHYRANPWGLFDMHGNVWEWCSDGYGPYQAGEIVDPRGPSKAPSRVYRGGGWRYAADYARSAYRGGDTPGNRDFNLGFRLAQVQSSK